MRWNLTQSTMWRVKLAFVNSLLAFMSARTLLRFCASNALAIFIGCLVMGSGASNPDTELISDVLDEPGSIHQRVVLETVETALGITLVSAQV